MSEVTTRGADESTWWETLRRVLSVKLVVVLAVAMALVFTFVKVADEVIEGETSEVDAAIIMGLHQFQTPALDAFMSGVTWLGSVPVLGGIVLLLAGWAFWTRHRALAMIFLVSASSAGLLNTVLKLSFQRARPTLLDAVLPHSYSFPSGHSMGSAAVYGMSALVIHRLYPELPRWALYPVLGVLVLLIGLSRILLGVHWPTDVLAGFAAGGAMVIAMGVILQRWPGKAKSESDAALEEEGSVAA